MNGTCIARRLSALAAAVLAFAAQASAQEPPRKQTIDVVSSFKPTLRSTAKIDFSTSPPRIDSVRPRFEYSIPVQNLVPGLPAVTIKPLAMDPDSLQAWKNSNWVKAGAGNLGGLYAAAGLTLGDEQTAFNILGSHHSAKGRLPLQQFGVTDLKARLRSRVSDRASFQGGIGYRNDLFHQYGADTALFPVPEKGSVLRRYSDIHAEAGVDIAGEEETGLFLRPRLRLDVFRDNRENGETDLLVELPLEKRFGPTWAVRFGMNADLTRYAPNAASALSNNLLTVPLSVQYIRSGLRVTGGITPSWDRKEFRMLPNIAVELPLAGEQWVLQGGWIGHYRKGSYRSLSALNPFINAPTELRNNHVDEKFIGIRGTVLGGLSYGAKLGSSTFRNLPLFVNDRLSGRTFTTVFEERLQAVKLQGEAGFVRGEQFSFQTGVKWYAFGSQETENRPWGMLPFELDAHLRWRIIKDLSLRSDFYLWEGAVFKNRTGQANRISGGLDLNAGLEFRVAGKFTVWTQFNNITNAAYQRWNQYDAFGFNMLVGLSADF